MKCVAKFVTIEAVKDKSVSTLLFLDWSGKRGANETAKMHGYKPLSSKAGSKAGSIDMELEIEDATEAVIRSEMGALIPHDYMYDPVASSFTAEYVSKEVNNNV